MDETAKPETFFPGDSPPGGTRIFIVILLAICGMFSSYEYLLHTIKFTGYGRNFLLVRDTLPHKNLDTLSLVYHPMIAAQQDDLRVDREKKVKITLPGGGMTPSSKTDTIKSFSYQEIYFSYNPPLLLWIALVAIMTGCALGFMPLLFIALRDIGKAMSLPVSSYVTAGLITLVIGTLLFCTDKSYCLTGNIAIAEKLEIISQHPCWLRVFIAIPLVAGLIGIAGQLMVNLAISQFPKLSDLDKNGQFLAARRFRLLRNRLKFFLLIDSVLIVFSVLTTDAFRRAILTEVKINIDLIPQYYVYLYGVMFTFYTAVIYIPIYYRLKLKGASMAAEIHGIPGKDDQAAIKSLLLLQETPMESLKVALSILAPIISSLLPGLFKL